MGNNFMQLFGVLQLLSALQCSDQLLTLITKQLVVKCNDSLSCSVVGCEVK